MFFGGLVSDVMSSSVTKPESHPSVASTKSKKQVENREYVLVIMHALLSTGHETIAWISAFSLALIFILNDIYNKPLVESKSEFQGL